MIVLQGKNISKAYGIDIILNKLSFHINKGDRVGIIGDNGAGKTTLLNILTKEKESDTGNMFYAPNMELGYLKQRDNFNEENSVYEEMIENFKDLVNMEEEIEKLSIKISELSEQNMDVDKLLISLDQLTEKFKNSNGYTYKSEIGGILSSMAFPESYYNKKIGLLSGGERTRLALAVLLMKKPDILFLDEPTNHLDIGTLKWLETYLKNYGGTMVIISHDRYFLDQIANRIFEIENHSLSIYEGSYTQFTEKKKSALEAKIKSFENQQKELKRQEEMIRKFKQHGTEKLAKRAQSREKCLSKVELVEKPDSSKSAMRIRFKERFKSGKDVIFAENLGKKFETQTESRRLFRNVNLDIKKGERIFIVGANGIGKTTLLKIITGDVLNDEGYFQLGHNVILGYYDQEQQLLDENNTILDEMTGAYRLYSDTEMRSILGRFLFKDQDVFKKISSLSGGERGRLSLLKLMLSGANTLILDEPTNHLDIASKEVFEDALLDFPGTIIAVSHDRYFLNKISTRIMELTEAGINNFVGGYDYYMEKKESLGSSKEYLQELSKQGQSPDGEKQKKIEDEESNLNSSEQRRRNKIVKAEEKRREKERKLLEENIYELEDEIANLESAMCEEKIFLNHIVMKEHMEKLEDIKNKLEGKFQEWTLLNEA